MPSLQKETKDDLHKLSQMEPPPYQEDRLFKDDNEDEEVFLKTLLSCVKAGQRYRGQYSTNWTDFTRKFVGDFYRNKQRFGFECRPNKYLEKVELQANLLTQEPFKDYVVRADQSNDPTDAKPEVFTRIIIDVKEECLYNQKEYEMLLMAGLYGPGILKVFFNRDLKDGMGYPDVQEIDPRNFIVSPGCKRIKDSQFACYYRPVATGELKRLYPTKADKIKEDPGLSANDLYGQDVVENSGYAVSDSKTGAVAYLEMLKQAQGTGRPGDQSFLYEFYYRDPRWIELKDEKELLKWIQARPGFGNDYFKNCAFRDYLKNGFPQQVPLYPHGRLIFFTSGVILEKHPNPYPKIPFHVWKNHVNPHVFWPKGQVELISEPMANYHVISSSLSANWVFRSMPPYRTDDQTMDDNKFKKIQPNSLIKHKTGTTVGPLEVPAIPVQEGIGIMQLREQEGDGVSGVSSLLGGQRPQGVFAGSYFNSLQDSAFKVFGKLVTRLNEMRLEIGQDFVWMIQNYLTDERIIPYTNEDDQTSLMTVNQKYVDNSGPIVSIGKRNNLGVGKFVYKCEEGTAQPYNLISRIQQANDVGKLMIQQGYEIPAFALILQASGLPGWKAILRQIQQQFQMKIQMNQFQMQKQDTLTAQQRLDLINQEMAKLSAKIEAARIQAQAKVQTTAMSNQNKVDTAVIAKVPGPGETDTELNPEDVVSSMQNSIAQMLQQGVSPQDIMGVVGQTLSSAGIGGMQQPPPNPGIPTTSNLDPATPNIPTMPGAPPIVPEQPPMQPS